MERSENMRRIRSKDTNPELIIRRLVFKMGYRYRLHGKNLPGKPDLVFARRKKVIFIHGCFWHQHKNCIDSHIPKTNRDYWKPKLERNRMRDAENQSRLKKIGWSFLIIWECQIKNSLGLSRKIKRFFSPT